MSKGRIEIDYDEKGFKEIRNKEVSSSSAGPIIGLILFFLFLALCNSLCGFTLF